MNPSGPPNHQEDESQILAALGSSTAAASDYESSVLREATLRSAPQIALPSDLLHNDGGSRFSNSKSSLVQCGEVKPAFPDLSELAPTTATRRRNKGGYSADVPHVLRVLSKTQDQLQTSLSRPASDFDGDTHNDRQSGRRREIDLLRMKEQIILSYLTDVAGLDENDQIIPRRNDSSENIRSFKRRRSNDDGGDAYYGQSEGKSSATKTTKETSLDSGLKSNNGGFDTTTSDILSTNRLDRIKRGEDVDILSMNSSPSSLLKQKRGKMMEMKNQIRLDSGLSPLKTMAEERFDADKALKRREERRKRRLRRLKASMGDDYESEDEVELSTKPELKSILKNNISIAVKDNFVVAEAENSMTKINRESASEPRIETNHAKDTVSNEQGIKKGGIRWASDVKTGNGNTYTSTTKVTAPADTTSNAQSAPPDQKGAHTNVFCPVCQRTLPTHHADTESTPDDFLSKHIDECQRERLARGGGRTLRKRTKPVVIEIDEDDEDEDKLTRKRTLRQSSTTASATNVTSDSEFDFEGAKTREISTRSSERKQAKSPPPDEVIGSPKYRISSIDDIDEFDYEERVDQWMETGVESMREMAERDSSEAPPGAVVYDGGLEIPAWINNRLFPYQRTGVRWMWELHCQGAGGVVGDEMGLGKTVQVASFLGSMAANRLLDSVLIVSPATMLAHWLKELAVWAPGLRRIMIHKSGETDGVSRTVSLRMLRTLQKWLRKARRDRVNEAIDEKDYNENGPDCFCGTGYAIITTYESIRRSPDVWTSHQWSYVVLDEGQKIRNPDADVTLACKRLRTPHRLLLSGTPIQNDLRELWSLFDFVFPGRLGTLPAFENEFSQPIKKGGYSNASPMQVQLAYRCAIVLRDLINPYLLRRQKKDIKEVHRMPAKTEQVLFCRLSSKQRHLYEEYLRSDEVSRVVRGSTQLLKAVTVLRKICNHPDLLVGPDGDSGDDNIDESSLCSDDIFYEEDKLVERSGKLQVLSKILPLWHKQGHRVIIFCQWRKMLNIIESFTRQQGWKFARLDGNTNVAARQRLVDTFNNDTSYFCMLMTTKTGGVGLNVTGANRLLIYDPDWNPQTDAQARERAYRFGQERDVTIYRLITGGTIEEKIYQRQIFKTALTNQVLHDPKQKRLFSQKDLKDLFTLKADTNDGTETGEITRGRGVVDIQAQTAETQGGIQVDNTDTLEAVMKAKGICGVFDHDFVENSSAKKPLSEIEMEENARAVAVKAAIALKESTKNNDRFEPTWTGSNSTSQNHHRQMLDTDSSFGGANSAGLTNQAGMASSNSLLTNLKNKRIQIATSALAPRDSGYKPSALQARLKQYIQRKSSIGGPTTRDILEEFEDVPDKDADVFRRILKSIAHIKNGRWIMLEP